MNQRIFTFLLTLGLFFFAGTSLAAEAVASGAWTKKSVRTQGTWEIVKEGDQHFVVLSDDFKTSKAPDLKIFLSPLALDKAGNKNATTGAVFVGPLKSYRGGQRLAIPQGTDLSKHKIILLHCEQYSKLFAASALIGS